MGFIVLKILNSDIAYGFLIWFIGCLCMVVSNYHIYDIYTDDNHINLIAMRKKRILDLSDLKIYKVCIIRYPVFRLDTNKGTFWVNYTRTNYTVLVGILELIEYKDIEKFKKSVRTYILSPN
jgi:hypothetical protein